MNKSLRLLMVIVISIFISSCTHRSSDEYWESIKAQYAPYSNVEPKNNEPKAILSVIQVGSDEFSANHLRIYDAYHRAPTGKLIQYRFGSESSMEPPSVSELPGVNLPPDYLKAINQINIAPDKLFVFSTTVLKNTRVKGGWFTPDRIEIVKCKWHFIKMVFMPKAGHDYLLSYGAKPTGEENKYMCVFKLQEWDKKSKEYIDVPFAPYSEFVDKINKMN